MASGTGNLPYPGKSYTPFDILTAEELNEDVANIESLATGTGIGDGAVTLGKTSFTGVFARRTGTTQNVPSSTITTVIFNSAVINGNSAYNTSTGIYTVPANGLYLISTCVTTQENSAINLRINVNGSTYVASDQAYNATHQTKMLTCSTALTAGDTVSIVVFASGTRTVHSDGNTTNLSIIRLA